eukprot:TRINITY_DN6553_c0_g1_i1.p1 TRINITY_DN6553_c0_g1~~TRINITY_DN6553_c0_g1_i1.p1  ORF type:complete len:582 (+),score=27.10 TRINITY_DN6553_c0_g1_i1:63-1808(+)
MTKHPPRQLSVFTAFSLLWLPFLLQTCHASDYDVLVELKNACNITLPSWNSPSNTDFCSWQGILCDQSGRVTSLDLGTRARETDNILLCELPRNISLLTQLETLSLTNNKIWGSLPSAVFSFPNLTRLYLTGTGLSINVPNSVSPSLVNIKLDDTWIANQRLPSSFNWPNILELDMSNSGMSCPLPQSFVDHFRQGGTLFKCVLRTNQFWIDSAGMICGQLPITNTTCDFTPNAFVSVSDMPAPLSYRAEVNNVAIEFRGDEILLFAMYNTSRGFKDYRREYLSLKMVPLAEQSSLDEFHIHRMANVSRWESFTSVGSTILRVNATRVDNLVMEYIFRFDSPDDAFGRKVFKFSILVYNLGHPWLNTTSLGVVQLGVIISYKVAHSPVAGPILYCPKPNLFYDTCVSPIATIESQALPTEEFQHKVTTPTIEMSLRFSLKGTIDGVYLNYTNARVQLTVNAIPFPSVVWLRINSEANYSTALASLSAPPETQAVSFALRIITASFSGRLEYDPDVSITLLFNPENIVEPPGELAQSPVIAAVSTGLVVGVTIAAIAVAAVLALGFAKLVFPCVFFPVLLFS